MLPFFGLGGGQGACVGERAVAEEEGLHDAGAVGVFLGSELEREEHTVDVADQLEQFARVEERPGPV